MQIKSNHTIWGRIGVLAIVGVMLVLFWIQRTQAQMLSPYSDFQGMTLSQLVTLQVKLTYLGPTTEPVSSLAFTSETNTLDLSLFVPFRDPGFSYSNDDLVPALTFSATPDELKAAIDNVGTLPNVIAGGVATNPFLSFALFNSQPIDKGFEAIVNASDATDLFTQLRLGLANNTEGLRKVSEIACPLDLLEPERPTDVTGDVSVVLRGVRLDRSTGRFVGTAEVTNNSGGILAGPVSLVFLAERNIRLANTDGTTCGTSPVGLPFINLSTSPGSGESTEIKLEFNNPDLEEIKMTIKVLSGPGAR